MLVPPLTPTKMSVSGWLHQWWILPNHFKKKYQSLWTLPKNRKGSNTFHFILWGQYYHHTKTRQKHQKEIKLSTHISYDNRCKTFLPNTRKPNLETYKNNYIHNQVGYILWTHGWSDLWKSVSVIVPMK